MVSFAGTSYSVGRSWARQPVEVCLHRGRVGPAVPRRQDHPHPPDPSRSVPRTRRVRQPGAKKLHGAARTVTESDPSDREQSARLAGLAAHYDERATQGPSPRAILTREARTLIFPVMDAVTAWSAVGALATVAAAGVAAWAARQSRNSAKEANMAAGSLAAIERDRRHEELTPVFELKFAETGPDSANLQVKLTGGRLERLDQVAKR